MEENQEVKDKFGGGASLGPRFFQRLIQAIDFKEDLGQRPRYKDGDCFDMDQQSQPLINI